MPSVLHNTKQNMLERKQSVFGQRLYASDFQEIEAFSREMRWLHNQSLHQPGIGSGFAVSGEIGDREVRIEPGYAIDSKGREIVLTRTKVLPLPPVAGGENNKPAFYDLTVSYPEEQDLEEVETRQGVCLDRGTVRLREEPNFCWVELEPNNGLQSEDDLLRDQILKGLRITIIRAEIKNGRLNKKISIAQRLNARPMKGPNIVSGSYFPDPEKIEWKLWPSDNSTPRPLGLTISVDTSSANFTIPPNYQAEIEGKRFVPSTGFNGPYILEGFTNLIINEKDGKPSTIGFDLYILMPEMDARGITINPSVFFGYNGYTDPDRQLILHKLGWYVKWIGIEG